MIHVNHTPFIVDCIIVKTQQTDMALIGHKSETSTSLLLYLETFAMKIIPTFQGTPDKIAN